MAVGTQRNTLFNFSVRGGVSLICDKVKNAVFFGAGVDVVEVYDCGVGKPAFCAGKSSFKRTPLCMFGLRV